MYRRACGISGEPRQAVYSYQKFLISIMMLTMLADVTAAASAIDPDGHVGQVRFVRRLSWLTVAWLMVDGAIGLAAGLAVSGARVGSRSAEYRAGRLVAASYLLLVCYI